MIKDILLGCVFATILFSFALLIFTVQNHEPPRMCAVFQDGTTYQRDDTLSIDAHHERTGQSFDYMECE